VEYNRSCYKSFKNPRTWDGARRACRDTGGHLVRIDNDIEQHFLTNFVRPQRQVSYFLVYSGTINWMFA
jgi:hypothetical protein